MDSVGLETFIRMCDSKADAARRMGVKRQTLHKWLKDDADRYQVEINRHRKVLRVMREVRT